MLETNFKSIFSILLISLNIVLFLKRISCFLEYSNLHPNNDLVLNCYKYHNTRFVLYIGQVIFTVPFSHTDAMYSVYVTVGTR